MVAPEHAESRKSDTEPAHGATPAHPSPVRAWTAPSVLMPFIQALLLAGLGFYFTDRVSNALEQKKLDLANVTEMQSLVTQLQAPEGELETYTGAAVALAAFGTYSIIPLMQLVQDGNENQAVAAQTGLRVVAMEKPKAVRAALMRALDNRTGFYSWKLHAFASRTLGEMGDPHALRTLLTYHAALGPVRAQSMQTALDHLRLMVRNDPPPDRAQLDRLHDALRLGIRMLGGSDTLEAR